MAKNKIHTKINNGMVVVATHGGARPGAGLPKIEDGKRVLVMLTLKNVETAKSIGGGNISKGIRVALDKVKK